MQPILAESATRRGRALTFAAALTVLSLAAAAFAALPGDRGQRHHRTQHIGKCTYGYVVR